MEIKLPTHHGVYLLIIGVLISFVGGITAPFFGKFAWLYLLFVILFGGTFTSIGYGGLKKTQDLKDEKMREEIDLIKKQQNQLDFDHKKLL